MFSGLLIILVPLVVGYLIPLLPKSALRVINSAIKLDGLHYSLFYGYQSGVSR